MKRVESERPLRELPATADDPLAATMRAALADDPTPERLRRLGLQLDAALAAGSSPRLLDHHDDAPSAAAAPDRSGVFKIASLVVAGAVIAGVALFARESRPAETGARPRPAVHHSPKKSAPPAAAPVTEQAQTHRALPSSAPAERDQSSSRGRARAERKPGGEGARTLERMQSPQPARPADELELLRRAQAALPHDGRQALLHVQAHERAFPHGLLEQEREVLAITALLSIGDSARAERRASSFRQAFPHSAHTRRVDRLLARERTAGPTNGNIEATKTRTP